MAMLASWAWSHSVARSSRWLPEANWCKKHWTGPTLKATMLEIHWCRPSRARRSLPSSSRGSRTKQQRRAPFWSDAVVRPILLVPRATCQRRLAWASGGASPPHRCHGDGEREAVLHGANDKHLNGRNNFLAGHKGTTLYFNHWRNVYKQGQENCM